MPIKLETTSGSITLNAEDGAGDVSITLPRAGFGGSYTLPESSATVLGGVKVGSNLSIASGVLSATDTNTTYTVGDGGLTQVNFTTADNTKLDGIESGATADQTKSDIDALGIAATSVTGSQASAITANTAKTGITSSQASAITANTAKTGITSAQASAISANTAKVTNATHTGDVTGSTVLTIATDAVDIAMLSATGTAGSTTFLRGDNTWATAGSTSASDLTSGTLADARFPATLPAISGANLTNLPSGGVNMTSATTAPSSPAVGDQWYDTANGVLYVRVTDGTDAAWLDISSANGTAAAAGGGGGGAMEFISTSTVSTAVSTVEITLSGYTDYIIKWSGVNFGSNSEYIKLDITEPSGSYSELMKYARSGYGGDTNGSSTDSSNGSSSTIPPFGGGRVSSSNGNMSGQVNISNVIGMPSGYGQLAFIDDDQTFDIGFCDFTFGFKTPNSSSTIGKVKFSGSFSIEAGTFTLYGIKTS